jgi:hypothetical protein
MARLVDKTIGSIIYGVIVGESFRDEGHFWELKSQSTKHFETVLHPLNLIQQKNCHLYRHLPGFKQYLQKAADGWNSIVKQFNVKIQQHKLSVEKIDEPKDLISAFLMEQKLREEAGEKSHHFTDDNLRVLCADFWVRIVKALPQTRRISVSRTRYCWCLSYLVSNLHDQLSRGTAKGSRRVG